MNDEKIAVLGLGIIGSIWAQHYAEAGCLGACWNRSPKPDLELSPGTLEDCLTGAGVLQLCLYDAASVESVLEKLRPGLGPDHLVIQSSTIDGASAERCAQMVRGTGARYLEAPFTGSRPAAAERKTVFYLGGAEAEVERAEKLLRHISAQRFHIGTPQQAATLKLAMNLQIAGITEVLCESITLAREAGIDDDCFFAVMRNNVAWSGLAELKEPKLRAGDFAPQFSVKNMHKDISLARSTANRPLPALDCLLEALRSAEAKGYGDEDFLALIRNLKTPDAP